ncbi:MAG: isopenicillin N synthase family oxygenase [Acetobacteraceae bacterium]|nr:isopenicillin N synthase family oxygenase [Acetobacteraceae bacterium]
MAIPLIPLAREEAAVAAEIRAACMAHGFFYVADHGVPEALLAAQFDWAKRFFALPEAEKAALDLRNSPARRGWEGIGAQTLDLSAKPDRKESFYCGPDYPEDHPYVRAGLTNYGGNQWPALPGFREQMLAYMAATTALAERIMRLIAVGLGLPPGYFDATMADPMLTLRLIRYPPHPPDAAADVFGAGAHTDWGAITILAQDDLGGLEVQAADGSWIPATPIPGTFVVNLGDMIPRWTNGLYRSNLHRVINANRSGRDRYSIPLFYSPNYHARIEAVPGSVPPGEAPRFPPCTAGEHLSEMYRKTYGLAA